MYVFLSEYTKPANVFVKIRLLVALTGWVFIKKNRKIIDLAINEYTNSKKDVLSTKNTGAW